MWWLQILHRIESVQTERINIVVPATIEYMAACAGQREYVLVLFSLLDGTVVSLTQIIDQKTANLT